MFSAIVGGYGSGKTDGGLYKLFSIMLMNKTDTAYYLPTYSLVEDIALKKIPIVLSRMGISYSIRKKPYNITLSNGSTVMLRTMDNPKMIAGYEVGYSVIDEIDRMPLKQANEAFDSITARNRKPMPFDKNMIDFVCTPEGYKFLYNFFVKNKTDNKTLIKAKTMDNPFLPNDYIERLKETYTQDKLDAYLNGNFVNMNSLSVYKYDTKLHGCIHELSEGVMHVGIDFNIGNMSAVIFQVKSGIHYAVKELKGYDTQDMILKLKTLKGRIVVYPDASANNRKTTGFTDIQMLRSAGFSIKILSKNPSVKDRINIVNQMLTNNKVKVNISECPSLSEALSNISYKNGSPDKMSGYDHITDAFGYYIFTSSNNLKGRVGGYVG